MSNQSKKEFYLNIPVNFMDDERVQQLIHDHGMKGFGTLVAMMLTYERYAYISKDKKVFLACIKNLNRSKVTEEILTEYDFFQMNGGSEIAGVKYCSSHAHRDADTDAHRDADTDAAVPYNNPTLPTLKEGREETTTTTTAASQINEVDEVREWLINSEQTLWREQLLMKCGFGDLLASRWSEAVEEFLKHLVAFCRLDRCYNEQVARSYFATFCIAETPARSCLIKHLHSLQPEASGPATTAGLEEICETKATVISNVNERPE